MSKKAKSFEETLAEATAVIAELEKGELSLETLMSEHQKGRVLINECFAMLEKAEAEFLAVTTELNAAMQEKEQ